MADPAPTPDPAPQPAPPEINGRTAGRQLLAWLSEQIRTKYGDLLLKALFGFLIWWLSSQQTETKQTCDAAKQQAAEVQQAHAETAARVERHGKEIKRLEERPPVVKWGD